MFEMGSETISLNDLTGNAEGSATETPLFAFALTRAPFASRTCVDSSERINDFARNTTNLCHSYEALPSDVQSIRLCRLHAGRDHEPIQCSLRAVLLHDVRQHYDALSYTWGSSHDPKSIWLNGASFSISSNLWSFLNVLRHENEDRDLWADAICVDQSNIAEKNQQVRKMNQIYGASRTTLSWLGEPSWSRRVSGLESSHFFSSSSSRHHIIEQIFELEYWSRLWIVQEIVLAPDVVLYFGRQTLEWARFLAAMYKYECERLRRHPKFWYILSLDERRSRSSKRSLLTMIEQFGSASCTDFRDRIFGLLGMVNEDAELAAGAITPIIPNYNLSKEELLHYVVSAYTPRFAEHGAIPLYKALKFFDCARDDALLRRSTGNLLYIKSEMCTDRILQQIHGRWYISRPPSLHTLPADDDNEPSHSLWVNTVSGGLSTSCDFICPLVPSGQDRVGQMICYFVLRQVRDDEHEYSVLNQNIRSYRVVGFSYRSSASMMIDQRLNVSLRSEDHPLHTITAQGISVDEENDTAVELSIPVEVFIAIMGKRARLERGPVCLVGVGSRTAQLTTKCYEDYVPVGRSSQQELAVLSQPASGSENVLSWQQRNAASLHASPCTDCLRHGTRFRCTLCGPGKDLGLLSFDNADQAVRFRGFTI